MGYLGSILLQDKGSNTGVSKKKGWVSSLGTAARSLRDP
jgi:hypothetical protein